MGLEATVLTFHSLRHKAPQEVTTKPTPETFTGSYLTKDIKVATDTKHIIKYHVQGPKQPELHPLPYQIRPLKVLILNL